MTPTLWLKYCWKGRWTLQSYSEPSVKLLTLISWTELHNYCDISYSSGGVYRTWRFIACVHFSDYLKIVQLLTQKATKANLLIVTIYQFIKEKCSFSFLCILFYFLYHHQDVHQAWLNVTKCVSSKKQKMITLCRHLDSSPPSLFSFFYVAHLFIFFS